MGERFTFKAISAAKLRTANELAEVQAISGRIATVEKALAFGQAALGGQQLSARQQAPNIVVTPSGSLIRLIDPLKPYRDRAQLALLAAQSGLAIGQTVLIAVIEQRKRELDQLRTQELRLFKAESKSAQEETATSIDMPPVWNKDP